MSTFTPGPWDVRTSGCAKAGKAFVIDEIYVYAPDTQDDVSICSDVIDPVTQRPSETNARLIAAAPDLLEAAIALQVAAPLGQSEWNAAAYKLDKAIAKATGVSSDQR